MSRVSSQTKTFTQRSSLLCGNTDLTQPARPKPAGLASDESQIAFAASEGRVLVTFNVHFAALHATWMEHGRHHAGVVVSSQRPLGDAASVDPSARDATLKDRLEFLGDW